MPAAIVSSPKTGRIYWTAYTDPEGNSKPSDPMRFEMYAQRLGNVLLPGITNRTERLRYLSMVCAGLAMTSGSGGTLREQRRAFLPFERAWALAMTISAGGQLKWSPDGEGGQRSLKPEYRGLRGVNRVIAHFRTLPDRATLRPHGYLLLKSQDAQGGLGVYLVTLRQFGFVQPDSLALTAAGRALAHAFDPRRQGAPLSTLVARRPVSRRAIERLGGELVLGWPTIEEREIVGAAIFSQSGSRVADCVARMRAARPGTTDPRTLLQGIARRNGDPVECAAKFAIDFDPMRIAVLQLFSRLGRQLAGRPGSARLGTVMVPVIEQAADAARNAARRLAGDRAVSGVEPVLELARELADGSSAADVVRSVVAFHRREGRAWITQDGANSFSVGHHGSFEEPADDFDGYTVGRAMQLLADVESSA